jgi:hypothetical protein
LFHEDDFEDEFKGEFTFNDEFSHAINELIKNEVIGRMQGTVEELESQTKENNSLRIKVNELQRQIRNFDSELKKALKEKELEVKREFFGGFFIGDEVYVRATKGENVDCVKCNAKGTLNVLLEGEEITVECPKCKGRKKEHHWIYQPKKVKLNHLKVEFSERGSKYLKYWYGSDNSTEEVYKTEQECQAICDSKNQKN